jgi:hypothetical protein
MSVPHRESQGKGGFEQKQAESVESDAAILALAEVFVAIRAYANTSGMCNDEASLDAALMLLACIEESPALYAQAGVCSGLRRSAERMARWADQIEMREDVRRTLDKLPTSRG